MTGQLPNGCFNQNTAARARALLSEYDFDLAKITQDRSHDRMGCPTGVALLDALNAMLQMRSSQISWIRTHDRQIGARYD